MKKKLYLISLILIIIFSLGISSSASLTFTESTGRRLVIDNAGLLSSEEEEILSSELSEIRDTFLAETVILTVNSLEGNPASVYADNYFDYNGYGIGDSRDGMLLLYKNGIEGDREIYISTRGKCIELISDSDVDFILNDFIPYAKTGDFYGGFLSFTSNCDELLTPHKETVPLKWIPICLGIGLLIAFIIMKAAASKLKSVKNKHSAADYVRQGSLNIDQSYDRFLYKNVTKTARPKETSGSRSGGGSSTHTSSSGASHGGGGARF